MAVGVQSEVAADVRIVLLKKEDDYSWQSVPVLCERLKRFCKVYHSDADPEEVARAYQYHFLDPDPKIIAIVAMRDERMVAHLLVSLDTWMGERIATVLQYEHDEDVTIPPDVLQRTFAWLRQWAKERGAKHLQCLVRNPKLSKVFATQYGFHPSAIIMRQSVEDM